MGTLGKIPYCQQARQNTTEYISFIPRLVNSSVIGSIILSGNSTIGRLIRLQVKMVRSASDRSPIFVAGWVVWFGICVLLIVHDFGVVAFCGSVMLGIWIFGLREKFSGEETGSAYSVFNKDGKGIVGGFTASQFDRQMRGGFGGDDDASNPVRGSVTILANSGSSGRPTVQSEEERLRRRKASAAAAERRLPQNVSTT
jgi:Uncharacterized conserved domain (SAYSvFN)